MSFMCDEAGQKTGDGGKRKVRGEKPADGEEKGNDIKRRIVPAEGSWKSFGGAENLLR
jgi:hypothetical protein